MTTFVVSVTDAQASLAVVDFLARIQLEAGRCGFEVRFRDIGDELRELIELAGLADVLVDEGVGSRPGPRRAHSSSRRSSE
jgi:hypothetical protein